MKRLGLGAAVLLGCTTHDMPSGSEAETLTFSAWGRTYVVEVLPLAPGHECRNGGAAVRAGLDANGNGRLEKSEVLSRRPVCHGNDGEDGLSVALDFEVVASGSECATGGVGVSWGLDTNRNGSLETSELLATEYICNGLNSLVRTLDEPAGSNCPHGGVAIQVGLDENGNRQLEDAEVVSIEYVCNGAPGGCSNGAPCDDADPCTQNDSCNPNRLPACLGSPVLCTEPPANTCVDGSTLRVYSAAGSCDAGGGCDYSFTDTACANCPSCDACAGVVCDAPPSACHLAAGTCTSGTCHYEFDEGASCDDANACTTGDSCLGGTCAGAPRVCDAPPAAVCIGAETLRTYQASGTCSAGICTYAFSDAACANGCASGACLPGSCLDSWRIEDLSPDVTADVPMEVDASGAVHVVFGSGPSDYWRRAVDGTWTSSQGPNPSGTARVMATDSFGGVHVVSQYGYSYKAPGATSWVNSSHDLNGGEYDIAVDNAATVHLVYREYHRTWGYLTDRVFYARKPLGGAWSATELSTSVKQTAIDATPSGTVHILTDLTHRWRAPGDTLWNSETVPLGSLPAFYQGIYDVEVQVDAAGAVHAVFVLKVGECCSSPTAPVRYVQKPAGEPWRPSEAVLAHARGASINGEDPQIHLLLWLDSSGNPVLWTGAKYPVVFTSYVEALYHVSRSPSATWTLTIVRSVRGQPAMDSAGRLHLLDRHLPSGTRYAQQTGGLCNPCEGVPCQTPPNNECYEDAGLCEFWGECRYDYEPTSTACDDGSACTLSDRCSGDGRCSGTPIVCDFPPAPECVDSMTLRTYQPAGMCAVGSCTYPWTDSHCPSGCRAGACNSAP